MRFNANYTEDWFPEKEKASPVIRSKWLQQCQSKWRLFSNKWSQVKKKRAQYLQLPVSVFFSRSLPRFSFNLWWISFNCYVFPINCYSPQNHRQFIQVFLLSKRKNPAHNWTLKSDKFIGALARLWSLLLLPIPDAVDAADAVLKIQFLINKLKRFFQINLNSVSYTKFVCLLTRNHFNSAKSSRKRILFLTRFFYYELFFIHTFN